MTCSDCQLEIFEMELGRDALVHLTTCEACRELDREMRLNAEALAAMRGDVVPVRAARASQPWQWGVAVAAAAIAAFLLSYQTSEEFEGPRGTPIVTALPEPEVSIPVVAGQPGTLLPAAPGIEVARLAIAKMQLPSPPNEDAKPKQEMLVQMQTDDPDVVIYWLVGQTEGEGI
jgi:hypothetical protein